MSRAQSSTGFFHSLGSSIEDENESPDGGDECESPGRDGDGGSGDSGSNRVRGGTAHKIEADQSEAPFPGG